MTITEDVLEALRRKPLDRADLDARLTELGWDGVLVAKAIARMVEAGTIREHGKHAFALPEHGPHYRDHRNAA